MVVVMWVRQRGQTGENAGSFTSDGDYRLTLALSRGDREAVLDSARSDEGGGSGLILEVMDAQ